MELWAPRREDYFAAQVAYEVARGNAKHPGQVKRDWFLNPIPFRDKRSERVNSSTVSKHRTALVKGVWAARVQVAGPRPSGQGKEKVEKGRGRARKGQAAPGRDIRDARGKRFEVVKVVQPDQEELDRG